MPTRVVGTGAGGGTDTGVNGGVSDGASPGNTAVCSESMTETFPLNAIEEFTSQVMPLPSTRVTPLIFDQPRLITSPGCFVFGLSLMDCSNDSS